MSISPFFLNIQPGLFPFLRKCLAEVSENENSKHYLEVTTQLKHAIVLYFQIIGHKHPKSFCCDYTSHNISTKFPDYLPNHIKIN